MNYNKKGQSYVIDDRFRLTESEGVVEYCRVRFLQTGNTQVIPHKVVETGEFEDSLITHEFLQEENMTFIIPVKTKPVTVKFENNSVTQTVPKEFVAIATSPKGKEIKVTDLEVFCKTHNLDLEAVQAVLEGEQKTHKRWRFTRA